MKVLQKKVCLLGDFAVGKTSLIRRFVEGRFDDKYLSTIGVKISRKELTRADYTLKLLIWDLAGGDDFASVERSYLRGAAGALIVCDLTRPDTLTAVRRYIDQLRSFNPNAAIVLAGNKADLTDQRAISDDDLAALSSDHAILHLLTSAKTGANVEAAFDALATGLESNS